MTDVNLYQGREPVAVTAETMFSIVKAIIASGKEADFIQAAQQINAVVEVQPEVVNFVKSFLQTNGLHQNDAAIANVVTSPVGSTSCFPVR